MKHTYTLSLSLERNKNSYRTLYDCVVCVCASSGIPTFLSLFRSSLLSIWQQQKMKRRRSTIFCLLFGWLIFFSRHHSLSLIHRYLLAFFFLLLPTRFVDKRPRKGRGHPIEEKKQVISSYK